MKIQREKDEKKWTDKEVKIHAKEQKKAEQTKPPGKSVSQPPAKKHNKANQQKSLEVTDVDE